jgi:transcriptional regulator with XRE-family HTH domain
MMKLEQVMKTLKDRNLSEVSRRTDISYPTIWRISRGLSGRVEYETVEKLSDYLEAPLTA